MKILALDIATRTGIAVGHAGGDPVAHSEDLGKGEDRLRFAKVLGLTESLLREHNPDLVAVEAPIGGRDTSHYLVGLAACVEGQVTRHGTACQNFTLAAIRKHFLGRALTVRDFPGLTRGAAKKAIKEQVVARCRLLGWSPKDYDCADAMALWDFACAKASRAHQMTTIGGLFGER